MILLCADAGDVLKWIGYIAIAMVCFMFMIVVHELGHYTAGKLFGFKINEFAVGFGPAVFKRTNKKTGEVFSLRCIPAGGYCAFEGEDAEGASPGSFNSKPVYQRIIVLLSGVFFNFVSAIVILNFFFMGYGEALPQVSAVYEYADGEKQPFRTGDIILSVDGTRVYSLISPNKLKELAGDGEAHSVEIIRDGEVMNIGVNSHKYYVSAENEDGQIVSQEQHGLGISCGFTTYRLSYGDALARSFTFCGELIKLIFVSIGALFTGQAKISETMGGTVTAVSALVTLMQSGVPAVAYGVAVLSLSIALMNALPLPALDGSRALFAAIEGIRRKPLDRKVEGAIHAAGLFVLLGMAIIFDLLHFFG